MKRKYNSPQITIALIGIENGIAAGSPASVTVKDGNHLFYEEWETDSQYGETTL